MIDYNINEIYDFKKKIGEGAFGEVWEAYHIKGIMSCAIKIVKKQKLRKHQIYIDLMDQELQALDKLEHPHIVHVLDLLEDNENHYIVMEHMLHGNLRQKLAKFQDTRTSFSEQDAAKLVFQILIALNYLHK